MAWIEIHQHLKEHRKTRKFKNLMGITRAQAIGHLTMLWLWGIDNTDDYGIIQDADYDDIAIACDYHDDSQLIVNSLIEAGFLEKDEKGGKLFIHDFEDYIGRLKETKKRHREAQKRYSDKSKSNTNDGQADGQADGPNDGLKIANLTVPYRTLPSPSPKDNNIEIEDFFNVVSDLYENKRGRSKVGKAQKTILHKLGLEIIMNCINAYDKYVKAENKRGFNLRYKDASTFFNSGYKDYLANPDTNKPIRPPLTIVVEERD